MRTCFTPWTCTAGTSPGRLRLWRRSLQRTIDRHKLERPKLEELLEADQNDVTCTACGHAWLYDPAAPDCPKGCGVAGVVDEAKLGERRKREAKAQKKAP